MTLRLITDNAEPIDEPNFPDIPAMLRRYANEIEAGQRGDVVRAVLITEMDDALMIAACGEAASAYELMGLFEAAKLRVFADDNSDANRLHVLCDSGTPSTTNFSFSLAQNESAFVPEGYTGIIKGIWAADGTGFAHITSY